MSFFGAIGGFFVKLGGLVGKGFKYLVEAGLSDDVVKIALVWVRVAATKYADDPSKREFVVEILVARGFPEGVARVAVELAYRIFKTEIEKLPATTAVVAVKTTEVAVVIPP